MKRPQRLNPNTERPAADEPLVKLLHFGLSDPQTLQGSMQTDSEKKGPNYHRFQVQVRHCKGCKAWSHRNRILGALEEERQVRGLRFRGSGISEFYVIEIFEACTKVWYRAAEYVSGSSHPVRNPSDHGPACGISGPG